jgi:hypothetical protein
MTRKGRAISKAKGIATHIDRLKIDDRIAILYGGCENAGATPDDPAGSFLGTEMRPILCHHWRQPVEIEPGVVVHASAYLDRPPRDDWEWPEIGIYLSERWIEEMPMASFYWAGPTLGPNSQVALLPCPDGGWPLYEHETKRVFAYALAGARAGRFVEIGCHAGHGRTGLALAALMILAGADAETAMLKVWAHYCDQAIETVGQERYLTQMERQRRNDGYQLG